MTPLRRFAALIVCELLVVVLVACSATVPPLVQTPTPDASSLPPITANVATTPSSPPTIDTLPSATANSDTTGDAAHPATPSETTTDGEPPSTTNTGSSGGRWNPAVGATWQWQLSGSLDLGVNAQVYDVDLYDTSAAQVRQLHSEGRKVICYMSAGSYEKGRPDSTKFPSAILGNELDGWPGERWLDVRELDTLIPVMAARMDLCAEKGFDGVEPDNVDGYQNDSGFDLSGKDQENYNRALAQLAHDRGLAIGLKNDLDQVALLQPVFDFAVNEQCFEYDECSMLSPFIKSGKPVFHVEYDLPTSAFCPTTTKMGFSSLRKSLDLDAAREPCPK